jgi:hypothetical protein
MAIGLSGSCEAQVKKSGSAGEKKETRNVSAFQSLELAISANVYLRQGGNESLELQGDAEDLEKIVTEVSGSTLKIKTKAGSWNIGHIDVYITMKDIESLTISGSGSIKAETGIKSGNLNMVISGSGNINIGDLTAQSVSSIISGSGNINYSGGSEASSSKLVVTGSGNINAESFSSKDVSVTITGSGDAKVNGSNNINVQITGSGSVYYKGQGTIDAKVTGSGRVKKI